MQPGPPVKLTCLYCHGHKYIESISTGNTFDATIWSDYKKEYPMLPQPFPVQKCSKCGKYYFYRDSIPKEGVFQWIGRQFERFYINFIDDGTYSMKKSKELWPPQELYDQIMQESYSNGFGDLSFEEMNAAYDMLYSDRLPEKKKIILIMEWFYAFNDEFNGRRKEADWSIIPESIIEKHEVIITEIVKRIKGNNVVLAELYRESGQFDKCIELIGDVSMLRQGDVFFAEQILEHARAKDRSVFQIQFNKTL